MRTLTSIILISTFAYLALTQTAPGSTFSVTGCASVSGLTGTVNLCTSCNTGFVLTNQSSSCATACPTGCKVCLSSTTCVAGGCSGAWAFNPANGACIDCTGTTTPSVGGTATFTTTGCTACTIGTSATATVNQVACTACPSTGYASLTSGTCYACGTAQKQYQAGSTTVFMTGISQCSACTSTATTIATGQTFPGAASNPYVTCTSCGGGFVLVLSYAVGTAFATSGGSATVVVAVTQTGNANQYVSTPVCITAQSATAYGTTAPTIDNWGNSLSAGGDTTGAQTTANTNCANGYLFFAAIQGATTTGYSSYGVKYVIQCTASQTSGNFAAVGSALPQTPSSTLVILTPGSGATSQVVPLANLPTSGVTNIGTGSNCAYGYFIQSGYTGNGVITGQAYAAANTVTSAVCTSCSSGTLVSGACIAAFTGCTVPLTSTTCTTAASGYTVLSTGAVAACTASTTTCTGGCPASTMMVFNGSCVSGTPMTNCLIHNTSSFCVQCNGYVSQVTNCTACSAGCSVCSSATNCTNCSTGYTLTSTFTCASSASTTSKSSNMLLSGLAFISMIFYYLF